MRDSPAAGGDTASVDVTMSIARANALALVLVPPLVALFLVPYALLWGGLALLDGVDRFSLPIVLLAFAASIVLHEALHGVGYLVAGGASRSSARFGVWDLTPYAHCAAPMPAHAYRTAVLLPLLVLGVLPGIVGLAFGNATLTLYATLMTVSTAGDLLVVWAIRSVPGDTLVRDHPSRVGCEILPA